MSARRRRTAVGALTTVVAALLAFGCGGGDNGGPRGAVDASRVAAWVNGVAIRAGAVEEQYVVALATFHGAKSATADEAGRTAVRAQMLGGLIQLELLEQAAANKDIRVEQGDLDGQRAALTAAGGGEGAYARRVAGIPTRVVQQQLREAVLEDKLMAALAVDVDVPEADVVTFYETNRKTRFGPSVTSRHILAADDAEAAAVLGRLRRGEDFAAVAKDVSLDDATARNGGQLGAIRRGTTLAAVEDALFSAAPGAVVGPIRTEAGLEILQVTRRQEARPLESVRDEIRAELAMVRGRQRLADLIASEAVTANVKVNDDFGRWVPDKAIVLPPAEDR